MMHTLLYSEMNQAVPGVSLSPGHEGGGYGECQVPSPSQWSDPCYSPPSFHSPQHLPGELDKVKEEPFSPPPSNTYVSLPPSPPTSHPLSLSPQAQHHVSMTPPGPMHVSSSGPSPHHVSPYARPPPSVKKDGFEASINITELLAENQALSSSLSPTSYGSYPDHPLLRGRLEDNAQKKVGYTCPSNDNLSFLDTLVDVKQEVEEEVSVGSSCGSPAAPSPGCASQKEILETVELALEHARRDVQRVSESLNIPRDDADEESTTNNNGRGGTHIHLWQFLKELLHQPQLYGSCIRWLDRPKGVFKIEDSVRVARLWGKRKNRPAMNYDKLSRSIRQYYKKGIMKKTERSQRLVYQFCHPYCL